LVNPVGAEGALADAEILFPVRQGQLDKGINATYAIGTCVNTFVAADTQGHVIQNHAVGPFIGGASSIALLTEFHSFAGFGLRAFFNAGRHILAFISGAIIAETGEKMFLGIRKFAELNVLDHCIKSSHGGENVSRYSEICRTQRS
jgi:hypothetical protein